MSARGVSVARVVVPFDAEALAHHRRLIARMAGGDVEALQLLYLELGPVIHGLVRRILEDPDDARVALQETLLKAWRQAGAYRETGGEVVTWLVFFARHAAIERTQKGARRRLLHDLPPRELAGGEASEPGGRPEGQGPLTAPQREAVEMAFFSGYAPAEIASITHTTTASVTNHLARGLGKIRALAGAPLKEDFSAEAFRCLLDELEPVRRSAVVEELARDPAAAAEFKRCADALAQFACDAAPAEPMTAAAQRLALAAILGGTGGRARTGAAGAQPRGWQRYGWWAAALLLGLNFLQFEVERRRALAVNEAAMHDPTASVLVATRAKAADERRQLEKLRADYAELKQASDVTRSEYDAIIHQLAERALTGDGIARFAVMELVDFGSYARGERKGLVALARGVLTTPGIVAAAPMTPPAKAVETGSSAKSVAAPTAASTAKASADVLADAAARDLDAVSPRPTLVPVTPSSPSAGAPVVAEAPYGWSVFDESEGVGFLNLYNLPKVAPDQTLQLWIKSAGSGDYRSIGEVPAQFYGGSGSLSYKLPEGASVPAEMLVTREPHGTPSTRPAGPVILRGP